MKVKLLQEFRGHAKGKTIEVTADLAKSLIADKVAEKSEIIKPKKGKKK